MKYQLFTLLLIGAASAAKDISSDCSSSQRDAIINANQACAQLANAAAEAAKSGSREIFEEFFKDGSDSTRSEVAERFRKVADECSSSSEGILTSSCTDQRQHCQGNILAYTHWEIQGEKREGGTCYCRSYFELEASSGSCGEQSQGSNTLHETTHAVIDTQDVTYGLDNVKGLSSSQALQNADTYTFYAIGELDE